MKITVVANETGEVITAVIHPLGEPSSLEGRDSIRVKPLDGQSVVTTDAPSELANRMADAEYLETLRYGFEVRDGALIKKQ